MKKNVSETKTENIFRDFYGSTTFIEKSAIPAEYGFKSKKGTEYNGYPDFFIDRGLYAIIVEAKALLHDKAREEIKYYLFNNKLRNKKDLIGIAISGQNKNSLNVTYYCLFKGKSEIVELVSTKLLKIENIEKLYLSKKNGDQISDAELNTILISLNQTFHDNNVRDTDRSLLFSGIMIALKNPNFRNTYKSIQAPSDEERANVGINLLDAHYMNDAILKAVDIELKGKINNLSKEFSWRDRFSFIKTIDIPLLKYIEIIEIVESKIFMPFRCDEKLDILGRAYKTFLKRAGKVDNKNIILTPDHVKNLMVKLARVSVDDVILDTCTGSGGFLMQAMEAMIKQANGDATKIESITEKQLIGFEIDPVLFSLACSNMFLHGDGRTNMLYRSSLLDLSIKQDILVFEEIRKLKPTKAIINPPYENGNPIKFTKQALDYLEPNGTLITIMPNPTLSSNVGKLTDDILRIAKLDFVIKMPVAIFKEQDRTVYTSIFGFTKTPHRKDDEVVFYELKEDGLVSVQHKGRVDKYNKWSEIESDILDCVLNKKEKGGFCEKRRIYVEDKIVLAGVKKQILDLPNLVKFSDIFDTSTSGTLQSEDNNPEGEYDFITAAEKWKKHDSYSHDQEAIIYAVGAEGSLGRAHYVKGKFIASTLCLILTPKNPKKYPVDLEFYAHYLMAIREKIVVALRNGTSKLTIKPEELDEYPIEYFDIIEQKNKKKKIIERIETLKELQEKLNQAENNIYNDVSLM
ncbi:MAG: N-6 DNA methylase [Oscillospiraceae bacterium]|nr:N-6 DNA methylase [Oscillospiraceae bacterium]